jgi:hypothetical protein
MLLLQTVTTTSDPLALARAMAADQRFIIGAEFETLPPAGTPHAVSTTPLAGFSTSRFSYAIMTTGNAAFAEQPNEGDASASLGGGNVRGDTDYDVSILRIDLSVPHGYNCLSFDFRFLSDEFPNYIGGAFNDAFIAELDVSDWTTSGSVITAPNNFAFDEAGNVISINSAGEARMFAEEAEGTTYNGATRLLRARTPIEPGARSLYLSIFDQGDDSYDSAVFIDNLTLGTVSSDNECLPGTTNEPPRAPYLVFPANNVTVTELPAFTLSATDPDGDMLRYKIEVSRDNFQTVAKVFDQAQDAFGWSKPLYTSGETASFTPAPTTSLPAGKLYWRAFAFDGISWSEASEAEVFVYDPIVEWQRADPSSVVVDRPLFIYYPSRCLGRRKPLPLRTGYQ